IFKALRGKASHVANQHLAHKIVYHFPLTLTERMHSSHARIFEQNRCPDDESFSAKKREQLATIPRLDELILEVRGQKVMLDTDLAMLYGVTTKALNQAVKRNRERFPS